MEACENSDKLADVLEGPCKLLTGTEALEHLITSHVRGSRM